MSYTKEHLESLDPDDMNVLELRAEVKRLRAQPAAEEAPRTTGYSQNITVRDADAPGDFRWFGWSDLVLRDPLHYVEHRQTTRVPQTATTSTTIVGTDNRPYRGTDVDNPYRTPYLTFDTTGEWPEE